jgi:hypothetical protein
LHLQAIHWERRQQLYSAANEEHANIGMARRAAGEVCDPRQLFNNDQMPRGAATSALDNRAGAGA